MRYWLANGIYTFDELGDSEKEKAEVPTKTTPESVPDITRLTTLE